MERSQKKTFITNGLATGITFELDGDTAFLFDSQSFTKITEWGKNKEDKDFINYVNVPFKWENCGINFTGPYVLKNGKVSHYSYTTSIIGKYVGTFTAEAGYKLSDNKVTKVNNCDSDGYKLDWGLKLNDNQIWSLNDQFQYY